MKHFVTSLFLAATVASMPAAVDAQTAAPTRHRHHLPSHSSRVAGKHSMAKQSPAYKTPANKTTADNACRLIAVASSEYSSGAYVPVDSTVVSYSGNRGSRISIAKDIWDIRCDNGTGYEYDGSAYSNVFRLSQTFDAAGNILTATYEENTSGTWENSGKEIYTYDSRNNRTSELYQDWDASTSSWENSNRYTTTYTTDNKIETEIDEYWDGSSGGWQQYDRTLNFYDGARNLTYTVSQNWNSSTTTWDSSSRANFTYDGAGNRISGIAESWDGMASVWINNSRYTYTYDGSNDLLTEVREGWVDTSSSWDIADRTTYSGYTNHEPGVVITEMIFSSFNFKSRTSYTYNTFTQPVHELHDQWDEASSSWVVQDNDNATRYYYENYTTTVPEVASRNGKANLYPVPADGTLHIGITWDEAQPFTVSILDMAGKTYSSWGVAACTQYQEQVPVSHLPAGNYIVHIVGTKGSVTERLVVAH